MSKRQSSERGFDEDKEDLDLLQGGVRKMRLEVEQGKEGSGLVGDFHQVRTG